MRCRQRVAALYEHDLGVLKCPRCDRELHITEKAVVADEIIEGAITCTKGHRWSVHEGIPILCEERRSHPAEDTGHETNMDSYAELLGVKMSKIREGLASYIPIEGPHRILDTNLGTGANYISLSDALPNQMGRFNLHGIGPTLEALTAARKRTQEKGIMLRAVCGDPLNLPYRNDFFHLVIRVGGVRSLSNIALAMEEMLRVTVPEGHVLIIDEGLSPRLRSGDKGREIIQKRASAGIGPPIEHIPEKAREVEVSHIADDAFYQLFFRK